MNTSTVNASAFFISSPAESFRFAPTPALGYLRLTVGSLSASQDSSVDISCRAKFHKKFLSSPTVSAVVKGKRRPMNYDLTLRCLDETERELLRVGEQRCGFLRQESQLTAVILLLLRCVSLFRSMVGEFRSERLDAFDAVRRAFLEGWNLAFQFRMTNAAGEAARWLARQPNSWSADIGRLEEYARGRGHGAPNLGRDYGELSGLALPTPDAAENSAALIVRRLGLDPNNQTILQSITALQEGIPGMLYRLIWLVVDDHEDFIPLGVDENNMPAAAQFAEEHPAI